MQTGTGRPEHIERTERRGFDRPRFRHDLFAETVDEQGARFIDVMDPDSGNLFRFYEVEYSLACGMDGERDIAGIVKWAQDELGLTPSQQEVRTVIATLGDLGFIEMGEPAAPELAPGVVVAKDRPYPPTDLELGRAGAGAPRTEPMPPPAQIALGAPGATGRRPAEPAEDVPLGAPGARSTRPAPRPTPRPTPVPPPVGFDEHEAPTAADVSVDLADHIAVRPSDVKEAVRASKVMAAIEAPPGLFDAIDAMDERPAAKPAGMASRPPEPRPPEPRPPEPRPSEPRPAPEARRDRIEPRPAARAPATGDLRAEPRAPELREARNARAEAGEPRVESRVGKAPGRPSETRTGKAPVELPKQPVPVEKTATTSAPTSRVSPVLIVLLILLIIGGVAFAVWKYVLMGGTSDVPTSAAPVLPPVKPAPPPPAPPPAPTAKIVMEAPAPEDIKSPRTGVIETILADQTAVKTGEPVVKFVGDKPIEAEIAALTRDEKKLRDLIDAATRRRDSAQASGSKADEAKATAEIAEREKTLSTKRDQLSTKTTDLDKFQIHAAANGVFSPVARTGQKVPVDAVVARLQGDPTPSATFAITDPTKFATNTSIDIAVGKGEQRVTCTIAEVQPDNLKVSCPADPAIPEGTDVTLRLPGAAAAPPAPAAPTAPTPEPTAPPPTAPPPTAPRPNAPEAPAPK